MPSDDKQKIIMTLTQEDYFDIIEAFDQIQSTRSRKNPSHHLVQVLKLFWVGVTG